MNSVACGLAQCAGDSESAMVRCVTFCGVGFGVCCLLTRKADLVLAESAETQFLHRERVDLSQHCFL